MNQVMKQLELLVKALKRLWDSGREALLPVTNHKALTRKDGVSMKHFGSQKGVCALGLTLPLFLPMCGQWMHRQIKGQDGEEGWSDFRRNRIDRTSGESRMNDRERT